MNRTSPSRRSGTEPPASAPGTRPPPAVRMSADLDVAERGCRATILPSITSSGLHRHGEEVLHRAALALAGDGERRHDHQGHGEDDAHEPGHDVVGGDALGVVAAVERSLERPGVKRGRQAHIAAQQAGSEPGRARQRRRSPAVGSLASAARSTGGRSLRSTRRAKSPAGEDEQDVASRSMARSASAGDAPCG